jgi:hypothetical protein
MLTLVLEKWYHLFLTPVENLGTPKYWEGSRECI